MTIKVCDNCREEVQCSESTTCDVPAGARQVYFKVNAIPDAVDFHLCPTCFAEVLRRAYEKTCDAFGIAAQEVAK